MLEIWGYHYVHIGLALAYAEADLDRYRKPKVPGLAPTQISMIDPDHPVVATLGESGGTMMPPGVAT
jgi:hypothetical protein